MGILNKLNIAVGTNNLATIIFESLYSSFLYVEYLKPSEYISTYWNKYLENRDHYVENEQQKRNINGKIFEYIISTLFVREKLYPLFLNAKVAFVPNINYDLMFYSKEHGPICISAKTSLRERYKQADLEAIALKYVHRKSMSFLLTLSSSDADAVNVKQKNGDIIGLDSAVFAMGESFNLLVENLKKFTFIEPPCVEIISSTQVITKSIIDNLVN